MCVCVAKDFLYFVCGVMGKEIDPSDIGKYPEIIKKAQAEITTMDVLVCGQCNNVFHFMEQFRDHKTSKCTKMTPLRDNLETRPVIWSFLLWKAAQLNQDQSKDQSNLNAWRLYQSWMKLDEAIKETWVVAGRTIQSFAKIGQGNLQEMPVKITKTVVGNSPDPLRNKQIVSNRVVNKPLPPSAKELDASFNELKHADASGKRPLIRSPPTKPGVPARVVKPVGIIARRAKRTIGTSNEGAQTTDHTVEKILAKRFNPRHKEHEYLIKWENITHEQNTWEPASHLQSCPVLLDTFEKQLARQKEQRLALAAKQAAAQQDADKKTDSHGDDDGASNVKRRKLDTSLTVRSTAKTESPITPRITPVTKPKANGVTGTPIQVSKLIEKSAEVVITDAKDGKPTGIVKRVGATVNPASRAEAQIKVIPKGGDSVSGVVRVNRVGAANTSPTGRVVQKVGNTIVKPVQATHATRSGIVSRVQKITSPEVGKPTITRVVRNAGATRTTPEQKIAALTRQGNLKITRKVIGTPTSSAHQILIHGHEEVNANDSFHANIVPKIDNSQTQIQLTEHELGQVLSQVESGGNVSLGDELMLTQEQQQALEQQQLQQGEQVSGIIDQNGLAQLLSTGEDGSQQLIQFVTGEDGTIYQVAGKNEQGQTILIAQGADGEQQCVYVAANDSDLGGDEANNEQQVVSIDGNIINASNAEIQQQVQQQINDGKTQAQGIQFAVEGDGSEHAINQPLQVQADDGDSQDGQITAEVVQADLPSPGQNSFFFDFLLFLLRFIV